MTEQTNKKSQRKRRYQDTMDRVELGKGDPQGTNYFEHWTYRHCPGSRLATGCHTWKTNLNNTEKSLKTELKIKQLSTEIG